VRREKANAAPISHDLFHDVLHVYFTVFFTPAVRNAPGLASSFLGDDFHRDTREPIEFLVARAG
jgi:hypothetical protein